MDLTGENCTIKILRGMVQRDNKKFSKPKIKKAKSKKKYTCIAKVGNTHTGAAKCVKHRLNDLLSYVRFLDSKHPTWTWFNVFSNRGDNDRNYLKSFTRLRRPQNKDA